MIDSKQKTDDTVIYNIELKNKDGSISMYPVRFARPEFSKILNRHKKTLFNTKRKKVKTISSAIDYAIKKNLHADDLAVFLGCVYNIRAVGKASTDYARACGFAWADEYKNSAADIIKKIESIHSVDEVVWMMRNEYNNSIIDTIEFVHDFFIDHTCESTNMLKIIDPGESILVTGSELPIVYDELEAAIKLWSLFKNNIVQSWKCFADRAGKKNDDKMRTQQPT